jgi:hypothetical protein
MLSPDTLLNLMEGIRAEGLINTCIVAEVVQEGVLELRIRSTLSLISVDQAYRDVSDCLFKENFVGLSFCGTSVSPCKE